jgi:hypothetical protein
MQNGEFEVSLVILKVTVTPRELPSTNHPSFSISFASTPMPDLH